MSAEDMNSNQRAIFFTKFTVERATGLEVLSGKVCAVHIHEMTFIERWPERSLSVCPSDALAPAARYAPIR